MGRVERDREIARRRSREKFAKAGDQSVKNAILAKVHKISPFLDFEASIPAATAKSKAKK